MAKTNFIPTRKWSKTVSTIIRNHQHVDGQSYRIMKFGESNLRYKPWDVHTHQAGTVDCRIFIQTRVEDNISASNREALERLFRSLTEQEEEYSTRKEQELTTRLNGRRYVDEPEIKRKGLVACGMVLLAAIVFGASKK